MSQMNPIRTIFFRVYLNVTFFAASYSQAFKDVFHLKLSYENVDYHLTLCNLETVWYLTADYFTTLYMLKITCFPPIHSFSQFLKCTVTTNKNSQI
jgi:hypothetical protein